MGTYTPSGSVTITPIKLEDCCTSICTPCRAPTYRALGPGKQITVDGQPCTPGRYGPEPVTIPGIFDCCAVLKFTLADGRVRKMIRGYKVAIFCNPTSGGDGSGAGYFGFGVDTDEVTGVETIWEASIGPVFGLNEGDSGPYYTAAWWVYKEIHYTIDTAGNCTSHLSFGLRADATLFDCPPPDADAWEPWPGTWVPEQPAEPPVHPDPIPGHYEGVPEHTDVAVDTVERENCPVCVCKCFGQYKALLDRWTGTVAAKILVDSACVPAAQDVPWTAPYATGGRYVTLWTNVYGDVCTCAGTANACGPPIPPDPPSGNVLVCPEDLPDTCCKRFVIRYSVNGVTRRAIITRDGVTFTSNRPEVVFECYNQLWRIKITEDGHDYIFIGNDTGASPKGNCPVMSADGSAYVTVETQTVITIDAVLCFECGTCCDSMIASGRVSDVPFAVRLAKQPDCTYTVVFDAADPAQATLVMEDVSAYLDVEVGKVIAGTTVIKKARFVFNMGLDGSSHYCPFSHTTPTIDPSHTDDVDPDETYIASLKCANDGTKKCVWLYVADRVEGGEYGPVTGGLIGCFTDAEIEDMVHANDEWGPQAAGEWSPGEETVHYYRVSDRWTCADNGNDCPTEDDGGPLPPIPPGT